MADGSVVIDIEADDSKFKSAVSGLGKTLGVGMAAAGTAIAGAIAALGAFAAKGVGLASDLQEVQNVIDVTFGEGAGTIDAWAKAAPAAFGVSELAAKQYTGQMGSMLKSMGLSGDAVQEMSTGLAGLAGDFASFYNLETNDAWEKLRSGIAGETEPLKQLGINMSQANLEAYALSQGINTAWKDMTQAEQATLRYGYLMSVSADAQGDFARTSDSLANQQRILAMQVDSLATALGTSLIPVLSTLISSIMPMLEQAMPAVTSIGEGIAAILSGDSSGAQALADGLKGVIDIAANLITTIAPGLISALAQVIVTIAKALPSLFPVIIDAVLTGVLGIVAALPTVIPALIGGLMTALGDVVRSLLANLNVIFTSIVQALVGAIPLVIQGAVVMFAAIGNALPQVLPQLIGALVSGISQLLNTLPTLLPVVITAAANLFAGLVSALPQVNLALLNGVLNLIYTVIDLLPTLLPLVFDAAVSLFMALVEAMPVLLPDLLEAGVGLIFGLVTLLPTLIPKLLEAAINLMTAIVSAVPAIAEELMVAGSILMERLLETLSGFPSQFTELGKNLIQGIIDGVTDSFGKLKDAVTDAAKRTLQIAKDVLGIKSPSKEFAFIGRMIGDGWTDGIDKSAGGAVAAVKSTVEDMVAAASTSKLAQALAVAPGIVTPGAMSPQASGASAFGSSSSSTTTIYQIGDVTIPSDDPAAQQVFGDLLKLVRQYQRMRPQGAY